MLQGIKIKVLVSLMFIMVTTFTGCVPVMSGLTILDANIALSKAKTAEAEVYSPYEFTLAEEYFQKARNEHAYSEFKTAQKYADKAIEYATLSQRKSQIAVRIKQQSEE